MAMVQIVHTFSILCTVGVVLASIQASLHYAKTAGCIRNFPFV
ncbi:hypothetical protein AMD24_00379 [Candidatus Xiphinematobacter sp. Idaho Grape]|nr:hypothetical protein AMD24_00379 [Candidatus Xiphinematobacter sp. Idaho Grape]